ncbi:MAG: hypothetical protein GC159_10120 [Phycisphaera sp.]|nr:hypothetical protein [Phycisphaera sp.]
MSKKTERIDYPDGGWGLFEKVDGINHGWWRFYYPNGKVKWERHYERGLQSGPERHYDTNSTLQEEKIFRRDVLHGPWRTFERGKETLHGNFKYGYPVQRLENPLNPEFKSILRPWYNIEDASDVNMDEARAKLALPSIAIERGRTLTDAESRRANGSLIGTVTVLGRSEPWPVFQDKPLSPIMQLACAEMPIIQPWFDGFDYVTVFAANDIVADIGQDIVVRRYKPGEYVPISAAPRHEELGPVSAAQLNVVTSMPDSNDLPPWYRQMDRPFDYEQKLSTRVGGWPGWIQFASIISLPRFLFQVDSNLFDYWECGDGTIHYIFEGDSESLVYFNEMC